MDVMEVDGNRCISCGLCEKTCPMKLIGKDGESLPVFRTDGVECMECGHCEAVCPKKALRWNRDGETGAETLAKSGGTCIDLIKNRRSCRLFSAKSVPKEIVEKAIDAARYAPSAKNSQPVRWTVITDKNRIAALSRQLQAKNRENPAMARRYKYVASGEDPIFRGAGMLVIVHGDPDETLWPGDGIIAATCFDLAASSLGLGTCWSGTAFSAAAPVKQAFGIPEKDLLHAVIMTGFPAVAFTTIPPRKNIRLAYR
jgi:nitroreductase/NAD-dependent dihydropyrimidine dehydrogenase PreA subunit